MAAKTTLDLYASVVRPRLADGPLTLTDLDVTEAVMRRLESAGLVRSRSFNLGSMGVRFWCLPEDYEALRAFEPGAVTAAPAIDCDSLTEADWPPNA